MFGRIVVTCLLSYSVYTWAQSRQCAADGVCPDEDAEAMDVSMLQLKSTGAEAQQLAELERRKVELLQELAELDTAIQVEEDPLRDPTFYSNLPSDDTARPGSGTSNPYENNATEDEEPGLLQEMSQEFSNQTWQYGSANCAEYGCGEYKRGRNCQCNAACSKYNSCCSDYGPKCNPGVSPTPPPPPPPPADSAITPAGPAGSVEGVFGHPSSSIEYPKYPGFTLLLAEEFDAPLDLDTDPIWTWSDGGLREGLVRFVKEGISFRDGKMIITASNQYHPSQECSMASIEKPGHKSLTSGELRSRYNMFRYGRYEVRMKAPEVQPGNPNVNGNFISTMFVYRDSNAHHWREIDFEITADSTNSLTTNLLYADGTKNWQASLQDSRRPNLGNVNVRKEFHTYMFEWIPSGVTWYFDGRVVRRGSHLRVPDKSTKIMMNLWIFGGFHFGGSQGHNNRYPMHSEYEFFRFYKWDSETKYPCADMGKGCLEPDDMYLASNNPCDGIPMIGDRYLQPCHPAPTCKR